jgi:hypothetical protein
MEKALVRSWVSGGVPRINTHDVVGRLGIKLASEGRQKIILEILPPGSREGDEVTDELLALAETSGKDGFSCFIRLGRYENRPSFMVQTLKRVVIIKPISFHEEVTNEFFLKTFSGESYVTLLLVAEKEVSLPCNCPGRLTPCGKSHGVVRELTFAVSASRERVAHT